MGPSDDTDGGRLVQGFSPIASFPMQHGTRGLRICIYIYLLTPSLFPIEDILDRILLGYMLTSITV